jgi:catechol 2,3-dioxygenase-like lactoylglutathione lyase family enzyme
MEPVLLSHTTLGVADVHVARRFYGPLLEALGLTLKFADETWAGWKHPFAERPLFIVMTPCNGEVASAGNGQMTAFLASSQSLVDECHALALELGATSEGEPGLRPAYHADYYGAYFRDPDGNKVCVCCHEAA